VKIRDQQAFHGATLARRIWLVEHDAYALLRRNLRAAVPVSKGKLFCHPSGMKKENTMRNSALILALALWTGAALADTQAAEDCRATLSPAGQEIYDATIAQKPTADTARSIITKEVEALMAAGKVTMSEGRTDGQAVGECLKKLD
jgi:hypothetical protein